MNEGTLTRSTVVKDITSNGAWMWPQDWASRWPECGISMVSNGIQTPNPPMLVTDNLLLLLTVLMLVLSFQRLDIWARVFSRVVWIERAWCLFTLLDIHRNCPRLWNCWWAAVYLVKRGLSPGKNETNGPPMYRPHLTVGLNSHSPNSGWIFWPNKLVLVGPEVPIGGWCWAVKMVVVEVPRHGLLDFKLSGSATSFWRLMELDLIQVKGWVGSNPPPPKIGSSSRRFSPYGSDRSSGALRDGANNKGPTSLTPIGDATVRDTEMEVLKHTASPDSIQAPDSGYGMFSPRKNKNDIQSIVWDTDNGHYKLSGGILGIGTAPKECDSNPKPDPHQAANSVWNSPVAGFESFAEKIKKSNEITGGWKSTPGYPPSPGLETASVGNKTTPAVHNCTGPQVDEDGFTKVTRRKKLGPIKVQSKKQKPVRIRAAPQQNDHVRTFGKHAPAVLPPTVASIASNKGSTGFNFARAVQGDRGGKKHQQPSTKLAPQPPSFDIDTTNRFSVLDIPNSIKLNKLIEVHDDLYPPDQSLEDGMEVDMTRSKDDQIMVNKPSQSSSEDQPMGQTATKAQLVREEKEEKDYGISNAQKMAITSRLCGPAQAVRAVDMDNWEQGEHEFFADQVKALGLDYDYCIEDVESNDENGTAQFFAAQMKVGMPKVPIPTFSQTSK
ncbi:hypothetical protein L1987_50228 [Smallanthus sonchifolius]|uniref:Uncharacterized protein n=1 Tax=Smallanthus sonchifolius TaxID=185202 RepID=A0ACB9EME4_9ASTR|nr:hypothetical protein L1987_50228 [Smallanthus sonchifolius]